MASNLGLTASLLPTSFPGDFDVEQNSLQRQRALINALAKNLSLQPQMVSGHYVGPGWLGALSQALAGAGQGAGEAYYTKQEQELAARRSKAASDWFDRMPMGTPAVPPSSAPPEELG